MKSETLFRINKVLPFLKNLANTYAQPIQQLAFVGSPDFILSVRGRFVALELKSAEGALRPLQSYVLEKIKKSGGVSLVASPDNWDEVKEILSDMDRGALQWKNKNL